LKLFSSGVMRKPSSAARTTMFCPRSDKRPIDRELLAVSSPEFTSGSLPDTLMVPAIYSWVGGLLERAGRRNGHRWRRSMQLATPAEGQARSAPTRWGTCSNRRHGD
jgi:hypothetical protein